MMNEKITSWLRPLIPAVLLGASLPCLAAESTTGGTVVGRRHALAPGEGLTPDDAREITPSASAALQLPIDLSGYFWVDTGYMQQKNGEAGQLNKDAPYMQGRFVLAAEHQRNFGDAFGLARVELVGMVNEFSNGSYEPHNVDAYLQVGKKSWDVMVGRFVGWEVFHRGLGVDLNTAEESGALHAPAHYQLNFARGTTDGAGQAAVHLFPADFLRLELGGVYGQDSQQNWYGARPVANLRFGMLELVGGAEILRQEGQRSDDKVVQTSKGVGGRVQLNAGRITAGVNYAHAKVEKTDTNGETDAGTQHDRDTAGVFADLKLGSSVVGGGFLYTKEDKVVSSKKYYQAFLAWQYATPIEGLSVKAVVNFSRTHNEDFDAHTEFENDLRSVRVRCAYAF